jgi:hypothetical protein
MSEILADWLVKEGYRVEEPDDHTVELWHERGLVARGTPHIDKYMLTKLAIDDYIARWPWRPLRD